MKFVDWIAGIAMPVYQFAAAHSVSVAAASISDLSRCSLNSNRPNQEMKRQLTKLADLLPFPGLFGLFSWNEIKLQQTNPEIEQQSSQAMQRNQTKLNLPAAAAASWLVFRLHVCCNPESRPQVKQVNERNINNSSKVLHNRRFAVCGC